MRKSIVAIALAMLIFMSGCGADIQITQEQNDLIAEYVAGVLLKRSHEYGYKYSKLYGNSSGNNQQPTQTPSEEETSVNNPSQGDNQGGENETEAAFTALNEIAKALGSNIRVGYNAYVVGNEYPVGDIVSMPASEGRKLLALEFIITNDGEETVLCNSKDARLVIKIKINDSSEYYQTATIFNNDFANMKDYAIEPGKQDIGVALFMISESDAASINKLEFTVISDNEDKGSVVVK